MQQILNKVKRSLSSNLSLTQLSPSLLSIFVGTPNNHNKLFSRPRHSFILGPPIDYLGFCILWRIAVGERVALVPLLEIVPFIFSPAFQKLFKLGHLE